MSRRAYTDEELLRILEHSDDEDDIYSDLFGEGNHDEMSSLTRQWLRFGDPSTLPSLAHNMSVGDLWMMFPAVKRSLMTREDNRTSLPNAVGIKFHLLCDLCDCQTRFILGFIIYTGARTQVSFFEEELVKSGKVVVTLIQQCLRKGILFMSIIFIQALHCFNVCTIVKQMQVKQHVKTERICLN
ncbi:hypothetical protein HHI36_020495 [Cryptolaemus montrouzieri]|uniref:PiggyBac transposable element-derived protein domain-containing protein n=1 Tax=Cryptolaemus montrouzieri TaxID=559131 RepID=A0ABD2NBL4_9CUCU